MSSTVDKKTILSRADEIIHGDREKTYGDPGKNVRCIATFWSTYLNTKYAANLNIKAEDVCAMMRLLKEARLINSPDDDDTLMDIAGYVGLVERIRTSNTMVQRNPDRREAKEEIHDMARKHPHKPDYIENPHSG